MITVAGNTILITITKDESIIVTLPDGYSYEQLHFTSLTNIWGVAELQVGTNYKFTFPPINSKSPNYIIFRINDRTKETTARISIDKFGQIPDPHYFDKTFEPILVTGDDGKEYKVIPSDQFK